MQVIPDTEEEEGYTQPNRLRCACAGIVE
jgi:hypothetical protein